MKKTIDFWNVKNENIKNLIIFIFVVLISVITILSSSIIIGLFNTLRFLITDPNIENLQDTVTNLITTSNNWNLINEILRGVFIIILIRFLSKIFNKSKITLKELGLNLNINQLGFFLIGIVLMAVMFLVSLLFDTGSLSVSNSIQVILSQNNIIILFIIALANAFWQEVVFRGYFQRRLINSYGIFYGILICAFLFTVIHGLARDINLMEILLGTVLFTLVGSIYQLTNSMVLATSIHATGNFLLISFHSNQLHIAEQEIRLLIYGITLLFLLWYFRKKLFTKNKTKPVIL